MKKLLFILLCLPAISAFGQQVRGIVYGEGEPLAGASVYWAGTGIGVTTSADGTFSLNRARGTERLVAVFLGYTADTITVTSTADRYEFFLSESGTDIETVTINHNQRGTIIGMDNIIKNEIITFAGLTKMACCNLAESFENSAAVTVGFSDAVTGARQIRMLGLSGIYTQLLDETRPVLRGLGAPYGLSYTPGMWLQSIQVSKGVSSVVSGHDAITGQINLEYRKPTDLDRLFLNGYMDEKLRAELNATSAHRLNRKLSTIVLAHGSIDRRGEDHNHDSFLDMPKTSQVNVANRWLYMADNGLQIRGGVKFVWEERDGGQTDFRPSLHRSGTDYYGSSVLNRNLNGYIKAAKPVGRSVFNDDTDEEMRSNIALVGDYNFYSQNSYFGLKDYSGTQNSLMATVMYNQMIDKRNVIIFGASFTSDKFDERLDDRWTTDRAGDGTYNIESRQHNFDRTENEVGFFAEYTYSLRDKFNIILGARADHSDKYDWFYTPRAMVKWDILQGLTVRASVGKGFRSANLITDNIGMLATGRRIAFADGIDRLEESLTTGGSIVWNFRLGRDENAALSFDYFNTRFRNQVVADQEYDPATVYVYNTDGKPYTNTFQMDFSWSPVRNLELFATMRYSDSKTWLSRSNGQSALDVKPLTDNFKALINVQYATKFRRWVFDATAQLNGRSRLPLVGNPELTESYSPVYPIFFAQMTRRFRHIDVYLGCENIGDYTQKNPVLSAHDPFSTAFNSSVVWGPLMGRKIYAGFRFSL